MSQRAEHYRGYIIDVKMQGRGWSVEVHPDTPDLPILRRSAFRVIHPAWTEALVEARAHIDAMLRLADWAAEHDIAIRLLVRPGDYVFPGAPIAVMKPPAEGADEAINNATALGPQRGGSADLEFAVRQLVEVAVRALLPGINDPYTAMSVLDRLGTALSPPAANRGPRRPRVQL